ncbi:hypothetical protein MKW94_008258 [Papaver nudicaule]|uniref:Uncharacterized protein n=1 Tax=Papaver nudicaule TaxID=74823 RepID=A0AA41RWB8_PAPNU|nr:hypothetical protein [Papaver nudicaule]
MGLYGSLLMLLLLLPLMLSVKIQAQSPGTSARSLDRLLQDYAYKAFMNPKTGLPYDGEVPSNLTGIKVSALRLRSGSLYTRGVDSYKEFEIPVGVTEKPYVERLVLVYQNLGNWSLSYYPLPGYTYLAPVLGLLAYDAFNLSATNLPELSLSASDRPILIKFQDVNSVPVGSTPQCVSFDLQGSPLFSNVLSENVCSTVTQGHFSIVIASVAPSPAPGTPLSPPKPKAGGGGGKKNNSKVWKIVGSVIGGVALLVLLCFLISCIHKYNQRKKIRQMETAADVGEALHMTSIRDTRAPTAMGTRTQPVLEHEYVP